MITCIADKTISCIENETFQAYARRYLEIERDFADSIKSFGLDFAHARQDVEAEALAQRVDALVGRGAFVENDRKSIHLNWISPACVACRTGIGTETFLLSTQCPKNCYFCFNPNQESYQYFLTHERDVEGELRQRHAQGIRYKDIALTGGEPLLHANRTVAFFELARELYPQAYTRLYTSGWGLDEATIARLQAAGLSEIRFSVKLDDSPAEIEKTLSRIELSRGAIPSVMVEMPVMPDCVSPMKDLLVRLDALGIRGINLLELCFPLQNALEFARRGYKLKARPYRVLYNYNYAGGLPVDGSESACIELLEFALEAGLRMGVHYCSLENKLTGQVFQQNKFIGSAQPWHVMSDRDYFLKSAKAFGADAARVEQALHELGEARFVRNADLRTIEFPVDALPRLADILPDLEAAVCVSICEQRERESVVRELALFKTTPASFDLSTDV